MSDYPHLLSPLTIGSIEVRNRVLVSAHVPGFADNHLPGKRYIAYQCERAAGGVGLQITGGTPVHKSGLLSNNKDSLHNLNDDIVPGYRKLAQAVHAEGGRILAQLAHSGGTTLINEPELESWAPSPVRSEITGGIAHEMSVAEIAEVVDAFGSGAERVAKGELDGVEILAAFGFLPQAFMSPLTNLRKDNYGGSVDNRLRFLLEVLEVVRYGIGPDRILGVRIAGDEFNPKGNSLDDMKVIAQKIDASGLVNYLNVIAYHSIDHTGRAKHWAPTPTPHGVFVELAAAIRSVVNVPVFAVGRITNPDHAECILAAGQADMVGMTRAHISDPNIVAKIKRDAAKEIRPCVGANTCIANRYIGKPIRCMHSPAVATPGTTLIPAKDPRRVVVVGAGPAGLEAARVAAECRHKVTLYEANDETGGQLALWAKAPSMSELGGIVAWRMNELNRLGVDMHFSQRFMKEAAYDLDIDVLVIATGAIAHCEFVGDGSVVVVSPHAVLRGEVSDLQSAIVWSDGRGQAGLAAAEILLHNGVNVEIVTSDIAVAADLDPTNRTAWYQRLGKLKCRLTAPFVVENTKNGTVTLRNVYTEERFERESIDLIVDWRGCRSNDELIKEFDSAVFEIFKIGDCVAPRNVQIAMSEAMSIGIRI
ncbi:MAG: FAD-dependent oxidoreductase [Gammaproteobacteria bacterium]|nr:FAD-dependent oxidoreductase [Gammaproteobacteria bacterium]